MATNKELLELCFRLDEDDLPSIEKVKKLKETFPENIQYRIGKRDVLAKLTNECWEISTGEILQLGADDVIFKSLNWDGLVRAEFEKSKDKIILVYTDDGYIKPEQRMGTHPLFHRKSAEILGYCSFPKFSGSYCDTWICRIFDIINRKIHIPVMIEHMHPAAGKAQVDKTMSEKFEREKEQQLGYLYYSLYPEILNDAKKLWVYINDNK